MELKKFLVALALLINLIIITTLFALYAAAYGIQSTFGYVMIGGYIISQSVILNLILNYLSSNKKN